MAWARTPEGHQRSFLRLLRRQILNESMCNSDCVGLLILENAQKYEERPAPFEAGSTSRDPVGTLSVAGFGDVD